MFVCGYNHCRQLGEESDNQSTWGDRIVCPPLKSHINFSSVLSFSLYFDHTVIINKSGQAFAIGNNKEGQISPNLPKQVFTKETEISIQNQNGQPFKFLSAVCGENYTLYEATIGTSKDPQLIFVTKNQNSIFVDVNGRTPTSLYGGQSTSASIDSEGGIIIITERILSSHNGKAMVKFLPSNEKAVQVACCEEFIVVLGISGRLFTSSISNGGEMINFKEVDELKGNKITWISGKYMHCIAVCEDGKVFGRGNNSNSRLGINKSESVKFTEIKSLNKKSKIVAADAGLGHSLFKSSDGKVFACGSNFYGHLLLKKTGKNAVFPPTETLSFCNDPFCIAGNCISAVISAKDVPQNTPNMKKLYFSERKIDLVDEQTINDDKNETKIEKNVFIFRRRSIKVDDGTEKKETRENKKESKRASKSERRASKNEKRKSSKLKFHKNKDEIKNNDEKENEKSDNLTNDEPKSEPENDIKTKEKTISKSEKNEPENDIKTKEKAISKSERPSHKLIKIKISKVESSDSIENEQKKYDIKPREKSENEYDKSDLINKEKRASKNEKISSQGSKIHIIRDESSDSIKSEKSEDDDDDDSMNDTKSKEKRVSLNERISSQNSKSKISAQGSKINIIREESSDLSSSEKKEEEEEKYKIKPRETPENKNDVKSKEKRVSINEKISPQNSRSQISPQNSKGQITPQNSISNISSQNSRINIIREDSSDLSSSEKKEEEKYEIKPRETPENKNDVKSKEKRVSINEKISPQNSKSKISAQNSRSQISPQNSKGHISGQNSNDSISNELKSSRAEIAELKAKLEEKEEEISQLTKEKENFLRKEKSYKARIAELEKALKSQQTESKKESDSYDSDEDLKMKQSAKALHQIKQIGKSSTSEVFEVYRDDKKKSHFAQKILNCSKDSIDTSEMKHFIRKCEKLNNLNCPNIVKIFKISIGDSSRQPSLLLELCESNLKDKIKELNSEERVSIISDISNGMREIHQAKIIHQDLNLENILLDEDNHAKVSDFGICKLMKIEPNSTKFMAPELLLHKTDFDEKVDVYSFGVLVYVILNDGNFPKISTDDVEKGKKAQIPQSVSEFARHLINRCWAFNPSDRPSFEEICSMLDENEHKLI